jgi:membrane-associated phospholipid phosphatase
MIVAEVCLVATAALALIVSHGTAPYGFEVPILDWLGRPSAVQAWADLAQVLGNPAVGVVLVICFAFGLIRGVAVRVVLYAVLAIATILISEHLAKPLIDRTYDGELTFPSGSVTGACATAFAMWLALFPLLGKLGRGVTAALGAAWVGLMSLAVVAALWHTPVDAVGSVLLSIGIVSAGAAVLELPIIRGASFMTEGGAKRQDLRGRTGPGIEELLGEAEDPVGVAQAQRVNQEKG